MNAARYCLLLVADCNVLLLHSKDVSSYNFDPDSNLTKMAGK